MIWIYLKTYNKQSTVPAIYVKDDPLMLTTIASPHYHTTSFVRRALLVFALLIPALPGRADDDAVAAPSLAVSGLFPAAGAPRVCPDTPLRLTFSAPPGATGSASANATLGSAGKIRIFNAADDSVVDTIDVSSPTAVKTIGGLSNYKYYPVIVTGNQATIYPKNGALAYGKTYYVTIDADVFKSENGGFAGLTGPYVWQFTTSAAPPAPGTRRLTVATNGTGDFCTVQGALDFIPDGNTTPTTILLRKGTYSEMVFFTDKHAITLLGEDRKQCIIAYATNDRFNPSSGNPFGGANPNPSTERRQGGAIYHRGVLLGHRVNDFVVANLTIRNTTPQGGSQAEAIILNGTTTARAILKDVDLYSYQDTLQINGQAYLNNCYIEGDVDFMWGRGPCFFENCTAHSLRSRAYYTQIRNPDTNHGFVYLRCTFDGAPDVKDNYLSRIATSRFPASEVVLLDCVFTSAVGGVAWQYQTPAGATPDSSKIHFWEFNSHTADGKPVDVSKRLAGSRQLKQPDDATTIENYSNPTFVLGNDWNPRSAPIFTQASSSAMDPVPPPVAR
jgi:pectin methylesterase-like acyl-CoA thioesterase